MPELLYVNASSNNLTSPHIAKVIAPSARFLALITVAAGVSTSAGAQQEPHLRSGGHRAPSSQVPQHQQCARGCILAPSKSICTDNLIADALALQSSHVPSLRLLELRGNRLNNTISIRIATLTELYLAQNNISKLDGITSLVNLKRLHLRSNKARSGYAKCITGSLCVMTD